MVPRIGNQHLYHHANHRVLSQNRSQVGIRRQGTTGTSQNKISSSSEGATRTLLLCFLPASSVTRYSHSFTPIPAAAPPMASGPMVIVVNSGFHSGPKYSCQVVPLSSSGRTVLFCVHLYWQLDNSLYRLGSTTCKYHSLTIHNQHYLQAPLPTSHCEQPKTPATTTPKHSSQQTLAAPGGTRATADELKHRPKLPSALLGLGLGFGTVQSSHQLEHRVLSQPNRGQHQHARHGERPDSLVFAIAVRVIRICRLTRELHLKGPAQSLQELVPELDRQGS